MVDVLIGCCGWPEARARYYSHFPIVELQDSFYQPPSPENGANLRSFFRRIERKGRLIAWEPRGQWSGDKVGELCRSLDLIHCVDPFSAQPTWGRAAYFRLHGRDGYRYRYTDEELGRLSRLCLQQMEAGRTVYCLFNNVYVRDDALRFQKLMAQVLPPPVS